MENLFPGEKSGKIVGRKLFIVQRGAEKIKINNIYYEMYSYTLLKFSSQLKAKRFIINPTLKIKQNFLP